MSNRSRLGIAGAITAVGVAAIAFIGNWEGLRLTAYKDIVGVWTVCYGETKGIKPGMKFTKAECDEMFLVSLKGYEDTMRRCLKDPDLVPGKPYVAFLSLAYNIGGAGFCRSSIVRKWNVGDRYGACNALTLYNKAGGRVVKGLVNRRAAERRICIEGLSEPVTLTNPEDVAVKDRPILRRGSRGQMVEYLQTKLGIKADGQFGPITWAHVTTFQKDKGLVVDGVVGPLTWAALEK